jgi:hypothetical protein
MENEQKGIKKFSMIVDIYGNVSYVEQKLVANPDVTSMILKGWTTIRQYDIGHVLMEKE